MIRIVGGIVSSTPYNAARAGMPVLGGFAKLTILWSFLAFAQKEATAGVQGLPCLVKE